MKNFLLSLVVALFTYTTAFAQLPDGSTAPDFTITDIDGNGHNLYSILDEGKPVLLDLFATWCGPCWDFAESGVFDEFDESYGSNGSNTVFTVAVEADPDTPASELYGSASSIGDWTTMIHYTLANDNQIADLYALTYYPTIYLICPDRSVTEIGQGPASGGYWSAFTLYEEVSNTCGVEMLPPGVVEGANAGVASYDSELVSCGGGKIEPLVTIQNLGTENMTACTIQTIIDGAVVSSYDWTGSLATFDSDQVTLAEIPASTSNMSFNVVMTGDVNAADDNIDVEIEFAIEAHAFIHIEVNTDYYPGETSWDIRDASGSVVMSGSYVEGSADQWNGGGADADMTHNHFASLEEGCYTFNAFDSFGDGQTGYSGSGAGTDGSIILEDGDGNELLSVSGNWGDGVSVVFEVNTGVGVEEVLENSLSIFPNPASNNASVKLNLVESDDVIVEVVNTLGQNVFTQASKMNAGINTIEIPVETLTAGIYYVNIRMANELITEKLNIVK